MLEGMVRQGDRHIFETVLRFDPPKKRMVIGQDARNSDGLNYLANWPLDRVEEQVCQWIMESHADQGCPVIALECGPLNEETMGALLYFFQLASTLSAALLGTDVLDQSDLQQCRGSIFTLLGRPEF